MPRSVVAVAHADESRAVFTAQAALLFGLLGWFSGSVGAWLNRRPSAGRWLDRLAGTVFIGLGVRMITAR